MNLELSTKMWPRVDCLRSLFRLLGRDWVRIFFARSIVVDIASGSGLSIELMMVSTKDFVSRTVASLRGETTFGFGMSASSGIVLQMAILSDVGSSKDARNLAVSQLATNVAGDAKSLRRSISPRFERQRLGLTSCR